MKKFEMKNFCRSVIAAGNPISQDNQSLILDILKNHPHAKMKFGVGVKELEIGMHGSGWPGFFIVRLDGTRQEISFQKAISDQSRTKQFFSVMRSAIGGDCLAFKEQAFRGKYTVPCAISGRELLYEQADVDHGIMPHDFKSLADHFIKEHEIDPEQVEITTGHSNGVAYVKSRFSDYHFEKKWIEFHRMHAKLRITGRIENLKQGRGRTR